MLGQFGDDMEKAGKGKLKFPKQELRARRHISFLFNSVLECSRQAKPIPLVLSYVSTLLA